MAEYRISGIWKNSDGIITHYAVHLRTKNADGKSYTIDKAVKMTKAAAVELLQKPSNTAKTYLWDYAAASWFAGGDVHVVAGNQSFLRTTHDGTVRDNLLHLINYRYIY
ncbi:DUF3892 domain-containing protein [Flavobacterium sp. Root420]|uniref:DUF3892 domain-containing protein n=1 Tax=Flavobacterium sp. Root420 TaxID=1736533 RepID=UPI0006F1D700|nr:DUF3892 domain-containing protein [Flavobacterium sp. Root420]KQX10965.1 hypothetical protein ASC72_21075 [Flavobacterium sp. Root420]